MNKLGVARRHGSCSDVLLVLIRDDDQRETTSGPRDAVAELISQLDERLRRPGAIDDALFEKFVEYQRQIGLVHGARPLLTHLRPHFIDGPSYRQIVRAAELVGSALNRIANRAAADDELAARLGLSPIERTLAAIEPGYEELLAVGRLDMLVDDQGFHFIELNADSPAGVTDQLLIERCMSLLPHLGLLGSRADVRAPTPHTDVLTALCEVYRAFGGVRRLPTIAIVDWERVATRGELLILAELFEAAGHPTFVVDPDDLEYDGYRLSASGRAIDLVYRRVIQNELVAHGGLEHPLIQAYRDHAVCVANSFRTKALNKKAAFAVMSDPKYASTFSGEERAAIQRHVPWTRVVEDVRTEWQGRSVGLLDLVTSEREHFVLKPNDEYGGRGVVLGWDSSADAWEETVRSHVERLLVVQERKHPRTLPMPTFRAGALVVEDVYYDLCPFLFAGKAGGLMVRVSTSAVTNVSAGGSVSGLFVVG